MSVALSVRRRQTNIPSAQGGYKPQQIDWVLVFPRWRIEWMVATCETYDLI